MANDRRENWGWQMPLFTTLTNEQICKEIEAAKKHVILAAPGISVPVAKALQHANQRLRQGMVQVVLEVSARATRLGYGEHTAVEMLNKGEVILRQHAGLRTGALASDNYLGRSCCLIRECYFSRMSRPPA